MPPEVTASRLPIPELILLNAEEAVLINQRYDKGIGGKRYYAFYYLIEKFPVSG
jgi:hypothetical protein